MHQTQRSKGPLLRACAAAACLMIQLCTATIAHADEAVVRPAARIAGKSIGEWTGAWWRAALTAVDFPFPTGGSQPGALGDNRGPVYFAVASPGPGATTYTYDVPRGKYVLLPLYTFSWAVQTLSDPCASEDCARALADSFVRATTSLKVRIDGEPVRRPFANYATTPDYFVASVPVDGWWAGGDPVYSGVWYGISSGYWLMLQPPSPGRHVVSIEVTAPYSSVCADGTDSCEIPSPGAPETSITTLILTVGCDAHESGRRGDPRCGRRGHGD